MIPITTLVLLFLLLGARGAAASTESLFANALAAPQPPPPPPPLVDFGANATTIDDDTRQLLEAFASAEAQLERQQQQQQAPRVSEQGGGEADDGDGSSTAKHPKLSGLLAALQRTRSKVESELSEKLDTKVFDAINALRRRLGPKGQLRLIEEAQRARGSKCKAGSFTPPKDQAAKITGPGAFLAVTGPFCTLQRKSAPLQVTLPLACTGAGVLLRETPAIFSAATLAPAKATTRECKAERKWGPEGTAEVVLFDPKNLARQFGLLPADMFNDTGAGGGGGKAAWRDGAADVKKAIKGLCDALLGNVTVKDGPNGPWKEGGATGGKNGSELVAAWRGGDDALEAKFEALREAIEGAGGGAKGGGGAAGSVVWPQAVSKSDGGGGGGGNGTAAAAAAEADGARREAQVRLRALAADYLEERLAALLLGGEEEGVGRDEGGDAAPAAKGAALAAALRDVARAAVAPELFAVQR